MVAAETKFTTIREFTDASGEVAFPVGTQVVAIGATPSDERGHKVLIIGASPLHYNTVWVNQDTVRDLNSQDSEQREQSRNDLAMIVAEADAHE